MFHVSSFVFIQCSFLMVTYHDAPSADSPKIEGMEGYSSQRLRIFKCFFFKFLVLKVRIPLSKHTGQTHTQTKK